MTDERSYWLAWSQVEGIGSTFLYRIQQHFGSLSQAWQASIQDFRAISGFGDSLLSKIERSKSKIDPEVLLTQYLTTNPLFWTPSDPEYPRLLLEIPSPPSLLHYCGAVEMKENQGLLASIGIVGTREPTEYGKKWTRKLSKILAQHGFTIVSGMASGIDTVAHYGCLEAGGRTIAVLGTGVDRIYPAENESLYREIREKGLLLSEYRAGTAPDRRTFPARNRIIAGLCRATIVMEAPKQSGALITARYANECGRDVYILPASLDQPRSFGCLELLDRGAQVILGEEHLLEMLGTIPKLDVAPPESPQQLAIPLTEINLEPNLAQVLQIISKNGMESISLETIAQHSNLATNELSAALLQLELLGSIVQLPGMRYQRS
jgi:DNA processing protein